MRKFLFCGIAVITAVFLAMAGCDQLTELGGSADKQDDDMLTIFPGGIEETEENAGTEEEQASEDTVSPFTGAVKSTVSSPIEKGKTRNFTVKSDGPVIWIVEGSSEGSGTSISETGDKSAKLIVGANETSITLIVKALSAESGKNAKMTGAPSDNAGNGELLGTATLKIKGWQEITSGFESVFTALTSTVTGHTFGIQSAAYGNGIWVMGGGGASTKDIQTIKPVVAWSEDEGKTLTEANFISPNKLIDEENIRCVIYDGPKDDKKFVAGTYRGGVLWSKDGKDWTKIKNVFNVVYGGNTDQPFNTLGPVVYGEGTSGGKYVITRSNGGFAYSDDAETWTIGGDIYEAANEIGSGLTFIGLQYGTGNPGNGETGIFLAQYRSASSDITNVYSVNGINWVVLGPEADVTLNFKAAAPAGYDQKLSVPVDTSGVRFAGDEKFATKVYFVASGGGKYLAFGNGNRAAIAHAEVFAKK
jgi:hypothetical protein